MQWNGCGARIRQGWRELRVRVIVCVCVCVCETDQRQRRQTRKGGGGGGLQYDMVERKEGDRVEDRATYIHTYTPDRL